MNWIQVLGIIVIGIGTLILNIGQKIDRNKSTSKIQKLSEKNSELTNELTNQITGGNSICYLLTLPDQKTDRQSFMLMHEGKYPLFDVVVEITNRTLLQTLPLQKNYNEIIKSNASGKKKKRDILIENEALQNLAIKRFTIGTLLPNQAVQDLYRFPIIDINEIDFFVRITTRSAYFTQNISQKKFGEIWRTSWRVLKYENNGTYKVVKEQLNPDVPLKE